MPKLTFVVAMAENNVIGDKNKLPWYLPEDLKRFKKLTTGKTVVMGSNTYRSIVERLGKPLPNRKNVVVTTREDFEAADGVVVLHNLDEVLNLPDDELMIIGGGQIYKQLIDKADKLHITHVHQNIDGDVKFPHIDWSHWKKTFEEKHDGYTFADYERKQ